MTVEVRSTRTMTRLRARFAPRPRASSWTLRAIVVVLSAACVSVATPSSAQMAARRLPTPIPTPTPPVAAAAACAIQTLTKNVSEGRKVYSADGARYAMNKEDAQGIAQIYVGNTGNPGLACITCTEQPGGPKADRFKMQPHWHPSGRWIFLAVERDTYTPSPFMGWNRDLVEGQLQNGIWTNMYAVSPDGLRWQRMTDFTGAPGTPDGFSGVAFSPDGKRAVWSQIMDGNIFVYWPFGRWELTMADFSEVAGIPTLANPTNITPTAMHWNEPGSFSPDNESLVLSGSTAADAQGMDQYVLNVRTRVLVNLTNSPTVWDEHGTFSPSGDKIIFMSAYPYREDPTSSMIWGIRTEFMLMNKDGSGLTQLTHFSQAGYPEYSPFNGIAANGTWLPKGGGAGLRRLNFPNYEDWSVTFAGACGG